MRLQGSVQLDIFASEIRLASPSLFLSVCLTVSLLVYLSLCRYLCVSLPVSLPLLIFPSFPISASFHLLSQFLCFSSRLFLILCLSFSVPALPEVLLSSRSIMRLEVVELWIRPLREQQRIRVRFPCGHGGHWWLSGRFGDLSPEGCRFEYHSSHHVGTLGKYLTRSCL